MEIEENKQTHKIPAAELERVIQDYPDHGVYGSTPPEKRSLKSTVPIRLSQMGPLRPHLHMFYPQEALFTITGNSAIIVRKGTTSGENVIEIDDEAVSYPHCKIEVMDRGLRVTDLGSVNGTRMRNQSGEVRTGQPLMLVEGDWLIVAGSALQFVMRKVNRPELGGSRLAA